MEQMQMKAADIEAAITALLAEARIEYGAALVQRGYNRDGWECDWWRVQFTRSGNKTFGLDFYAGTGHREPAKLYGQRPATRGTLAWQEIEDRRRPIPPKAASVLHSVCMDDPRGADFEDWCGEFGMDTDSRKALATYEQCQRQAKEARRFFGSELLDRIAATVADY